MKLPDLRDKIDQIDRQMVDLFVQRMETSKKVAQYKKENSLPVYDPSREREKLANIADQAGNSLQTYTDALYTLMFELSRTYQDNHISDESPLAAKINDAIANTEQLFPQRPIVACQGVEGAYSQMACNKLFPMPSVMYFNTFESVFAAIDKGLCRFGVLPLENSTAGSVNKIYDLMMEYDFNIVRSTRLKVDHSLLANKGTKISEIKEIFSHEQAINQCEDFIKELGDVKITPYENTAVAAKMVFQSGRNDVAAFSSHACAEIYDLECLRESVQDQGSNYTRFICISKNLEIYPGADKTSVMMVLPHRPGSLYRVLARFYALGINLIKLESRPLPNSDFEFMFYFDLDTSIYSDEFIQLICGLDSISSEFKYLGSYTEVV